MKYPKVIDTLPGGYQMRKAVARKVKQSAEGWVVSSYGNFIYGVGDSVEAAEEDWGRALIEFYELLKANRDELEPHLSGILQYLEENIIIEPQE